MRELSSPGAGTASQVFAYSSKEERKFKSIAKDQFRLPSQFQTENIPSHWTLRSYKRRYRRFRKMKVLVSKVWIAVLSFASIAFLRYNEFKIIGSLSNIKAENILRDTIFFTSKLGVHISFTIST